MISMYTYLAILLVFLCLFVFNQRTMMLTLTCLRYTHFHLEVISTNNDNRKNRQSRVTNKITLLPYPSLSQKQPTASVKETHLTRSSWQNPMQIKIKQCQTIHKELLAFELKCCSLYQGQLKCISFNVFYTTRKKKITFSNSFREKPLLCFLDCRVSSSFVPWDISASQTCFFLP